MIGLIQGKIWGTTQCIFRDNNVEINRITVKPGGYCSQHLHKYKYNLFWMESGKLRVTIYQGIPGDKDCVADSTIITHGMATIVNPNLYHEFEGLEDSVAYEIYWSKLESPDIERLNQGGIKLMEQIHESK